ncbi:MAG: hypothetical protein EOM24_23880 [Chloroflexia bacterium]|nr:hypothetical protein [Chloroflexia bacterium]
MDEQHRRTVGDGLDAGMRRMEQHKQLLADAALLCHCRNHFMEALAALKQISKETSNGEPSMGALVARGWLEKLEKVQ